MVKDASILINGFAGNNAIGSVRESLVYGIENKGKGTMVYLVDDPLFMSFWKIAVYQYSFFRAIIWI